MSALPDTAMPRPVPTQVKRPWRATARTAFAGVVAFCGLAPLIVKAADIDATQSYVATGLTVMAGVTRVMALPQVESFLQAHVPWLAATTRTPA